MDFKVPNRWFVMVDRYIVDLYTVDLHVVDCYTVDLLFVLFLSIFLKGQIGTW